MFGLLSSRSSSLWSLNHSLKEFVRCILNSWISPLPPPSLSDFRCWCGVTNNMKSIDSFMEGQSHHQQIHEKTCSWILWTVQSSATRFGMSLCNCKFECCFKSQALLWKKKKKNQGQGCRISLNPYWMWIQLLENCWMFCDQTFEFQCIMTRL